MGVTVCRGRVPCTRRLYVDQKCGAKRLSIAVTGAVRLMVTHRRELPNREDVPFLFVPRMDEPRNNKPCLTWLIGARDDQLRLYDNDGNVSTSEVLVLCAVDGQVGTNLVEDVVQVLTEEQCRTSDREILKGTGIFDMADLPRADAQPHPCTAECRGHTGRLMDASIDDQASLARSVFVVHRDDLGQSSVIPSDVGERPSSDLKVLPRHIGGDRRSPSGFPRGQSREQGEDHRCPGNEPF